MRGKAGATGWTVGKLLTLVLVVAVLALVIYGYSTGAITPLKNKIVGMYDGVLIMFGIGDDGGRNCVKSYVENMNNNNENVMQGDELLDALELTGADRGRPFVTICDDGECKIDNVGLGGGSYKVSKKDLFVWTGSEWVERKVVRSSPNVELSKIRSYAEFYGDAVLFLKDDIFGTREDAYIAQKYGKDVYLQIYNKPTWLSYGEKRYLWWDENGWSDVGEGEKYKDEWEMLTSFLELVTDGVHDKVYVRYSGHDDWMTIEKFGVGNNLELNEDELADFREEIRDKQGELLWMSLERNPSKALVAKFANKPIFEFKGVDYEVSIDEEAIGMHVVFTDVSNYSNRFALVYDPKIERGYYLMEDDGAGGLEWVGLDSNLYQYSSTSGKDVVGDDYKRSKIYKFLDERCGG